MTALAVDSQRLMQNNLSRERVLRLLGVPERTLRNWEALGVVPKSDSYSFRDLARLRKLAFLNSGPRITGSRLKKLIDGLARRVEVEDPLHDLRIYTNEFGKLRVDIDGQAMDPQSGQIFLNFDSKPATIREVSFPAAAAAVTSAHEVNKKRTEAESWFERGLELEQTGAPETEIRAAYEKAVELDPQSTGALVNLGTLHFNARRLSKALEFYTRAVEVDATYALAHFNLGNLYDERGDADKALHHYNEALRLNPTYPDAHYNLALLLQNQGKTMQAVGHWKTYLKLDPRSNWAEIARRELDKLKDSTRIK